MPKAKTNSRERLINSAVRQTYRQGFGKTSLADIAKDAEVPLGNVYYYFKTKDEIGEAIVEERLAQTQMARDAWDRIGSPKERLYASIDAVFENRGTLVQGGCAMGTLCSELQKSNDPLANKASEIFARHLQWLETQFRELGEAKDAYGHAVHLLSALQGVSVLAHSSRDPELVTMETKRLKEWVRSL
jgi:AcrR family transcriptional regulator